ncbi:tRNA (guanine37-N1)-methyltransferase [Cerasibacillus quisquiliarum]|uniref:tRNA (guanine-N(1)-)-methyltransferase n=1 Tax=Cerasibacillus quisquiliarum TaxID=227865 RepID=A0A511UUY8_9BACI|nr:tRNA (guanosine(37)-N1)-methyltransferase TrmD [Cerasibacillus quisquiliarum]MBB5145836.1 tRNA (guanine37-N1)-methyltransferase [Cerasibacillus quisquiliarum]GEN30407.1 tRNA (guanine-N(1)-)-methyltransferase [Cerasibacillus quisquiliarum]
MHIDILTLFPNMFTGVFQSSILQKALEKKKFTYNLIDFREYTEDKHQKVDDYPYGGGAGMVLTPQPIFDAVQANTVDKNTKPRIILMCPQGEPYTQKKAEELAKEEHLLFICGHYEGYDERIREHLVTDEISIGDYVLTGGELGAMVVIDSVIRLLPGVLGNTQSITEDSFTTGLLEHPHYTRPANFRGMKVPGVLLSGHHEKIATWRREQSLKRTYERRPELLTQVQLTEREKQFLKELKNNKM